MLKSRVKIVPQKILRPRAIKLLEDFISKGGTLEFRNAFEDLIAELDSTPDFTAEAKALFGLELYLHEADEDLRDIEEAYTYARELLEAEKASVVACPPKRSSGSAMRP